MPLQLQKAATEGQRTTAVSVTFCLELVKLNRNSYISASTRFSDLSVRLPQLGSSVGDYTVRDGTAKAVTPDFSTQ